VTKFSTGQSLIEVVIAIGVVGLVLTSMVFVSTLGIKTSRVAKERVEARHLVGNKLEEVRRTRDEDPEAFFATGTYSDAPIQTGTNPTYTLTTTYTQVVAGEQYEITVEATWEDGANTYTVTGGTYLSKWE